MADWFLRQVISEGETGVDRAALDVALSLGIACGGWCPRGRKAEDGEIPAHYPLTETESPDHNEATRMNVKTADAILLLYSRKPGMGSRHTVYLASNMHKPVITVDLAGEPDPRDVMDWLDKMKGGLTLTVAGSRESTVPGIYESARRYLRALLRDAPYHDLRAASDA
jgi:hypothetical protein